MEKISLWYCDNFVNASWQIFLLILPLAGAFFYGRGQQKLGWTLIGVWVAFQVAVTALTNLVFNCSMPE